MAYTATLIITSDGHILLPQELREAIGSNTVSAKVDKDNNVILHPLKNVAGAPESHSKPTDISSDEVREIAWKSLQNRMLKGYDFKNEKFTRDEIYDRYENSVHFKNNSNSK